MFRLDSFPLIQKILSVFSDHIKQSDSSAFTFFCYYDISSIVACQYKKTANTCQCLRQFNPSITAAETYQYFSRIPVPIKPIISSSEFSATIRCSTPFNACGTYSLILFLSASERNLCCTDRIFPNIQ